MTRTRSKRRAGAGAFVAVVALMVSIAGLGCAGGRSEARPLGVPAAALPVPVQRNVPIDPALQASARDVLERLASHPEEAVRAHAIELMARSMGADAAPQIVAGLNDGSRLVRFASALAAGELRLEVARQDLERLVDDPDESIGIAARFALHRLGDTSRTHDLEDTLQSSSDRTRANTALVLGMLGEPSAVALLRPVLRNDPDPSIRLQAAEAMWRLGSDEALPTLVAATLSRYPDDKIMSLLALAAPGDRRVIQHVRGALTSDYAEINLAAARALGLLGSDEGMGVALQALADRDPRQRLLAALALGAIGRSDAQSALEPRLSDADPHARAAAAAALLQLREPGEQATTIAR